MAKKKITKSLTNSSDKKLKTTKKVPKKKAKVADLHPKAKNKDSLTDNIKSKSGKAIKGASLGKTERVPLNHKLTVVATKKK